MHAGERLREAPWRAGPLLRGDRPEAVAAPFRPPGPLGYRGGLKRNPIFCCHFGTTASDASRVTDMVSLRSTISAPLRCRSGATPDPRVASRQDRAPRGARGKPHGRGCARRGRPRAPGPPQTAAGTIMGVHPSAAMPSGWASGKGSGQYMTWRVGSSPALGTSMAQRQSPAASRRRYTGSALSPYPIRCGTVRHLKPGPLSPPSLSWRMVACALRVGICKRADCASTCVHGTLVQDMAVEAEGYHLPRNELV